MIDEERAQKIEARLTKLEKDLDEIKTQQMLIMMMQAEPLLSNIAGILTKKLNLEPNEKVPKFGKPGLCNHQLSRAESDLCTLKAGHREPCENRG